MRRSYLITYDAIGDHSGIAERIKAAGRWWHYLSSTWIVTTEYTAAQLQAHLHPFLPVGGRLLIVEVHDEGDRSGWLPREAWDWLRSNLA